MNLLALWMVVCFAVFYLVRVLRYEDSDSPAGPFPQKRQIIVRVRGGTEEDYFQYYEHRHAVTLFDYFRRIFGLYDIIPAEDDPAVKLWYVRESRLPVWTCPTCLSFWLSIPLLPLLLWASGYNVVLLPILPFSVAGGSILISALVELMEEGMPSFVIQMPNAVSVNDASQDDDYASEGEQ